MKLQSTAIALALLSTAACHRETLSRTSSEVCGGIGFVAEANHYGGLSAGQSRILLEMAALSASTALGPYGGAEMLEAFGMAPAAAVAVSGAEICTIAELESTIGAALGGSDDDELWTERALIHFPILQSALREAEIGDPLDDVPFAIELLLTEVEPGAAPTVCPEPGADPSHEWCGTLGEALALLDFASRATVSQMTGEFPMASDERASLDHCRLASDNCAGDADCSEECNGAQGPYLPNELPSFLTYYYGAIGADLDGDATTTNDASAYYLDRVAEQLDILRQVENIGPAALATMTDYLPEWVAVAYEPRFRETADSIEAREACLASCTDPGCEDECSEMAPELEPRPCGAALLDEEFAGEDRAVVMDQSSTVRVHPGTLRPQAVGAAVIRESGAVERVLTGPQLEQSIELTRSEAEAILEMLNSGEVVVRGPNRAGNLPLETVNINLLDSQDHGALDSDAMVYLRGARGTLCGLEDLARVRNVGPANLEALRQFAVTWAHARRTAIGDLREITRIREIEQIAGEGTADEEIRIYTLTVHQADLLVDMANALRVRDVERLIAAPGTSPRRGVADAIRNGLREIGESGTFDAIEDRFEDLINNPQTVIVDGVPREVQVSAFDLDMIVGAAADFRRLRPANSIEEEELNSRPRADGIHLTQTIEIAPLNGDDDEEAVAACEMEVAQDGEDSAGSAPDNALTCEESVDIERLSVQRSQFAQQRNKRRRKRP